jgi:sulfur relay (sulfurtransferase) complex TusBCD TusD component (DsrE family)
MRSTIEMAKEAWGEHHEVFWFDDDGIARLVELARADEREACAKVCENWTQTPETTGMELALCATAIRARGETK